jgi:hypothetical protein
MPKLLTLLALLLTACAVDVAVDERTQAATTRCSAPTSEFRDWADFAECAKSDPAVFAEGVSMLLKAGAACGSATTGECATLEPIKDRRTEELARFPIRCEVGERASGQIYVRCCGGGYTTEFCRSTDSWGRDH